jgi:hypothetical protein
VAKWPDDTGLRSTDLVDQSKPLAIEDDTPERP